MYTVHLDLIVHFVPIMNETAPGIRFTRTIELPFPAYDGLVVYSRLMEQGSEPLGYALKNVIWNLDGSFFYAETRCSNLIDIATIPYELGVIFQEGWKLGSWKTGFSSESTYEDLSTVPHFWEHDDLEDWERMPPKQRPKKLNSLLRALVRTLVELRNNEPAAYALAKSRYFYDESPKRHGYKPGKQETRFRELASEYIDMSDEDREAWANTVRSTYPKLMNFVSKTD